MAALPEDWLEARSFEFAGIQLLDTDLAGAVRSIERSARAHRSHGLHLCNAYTLSLALQKPSVREALSHPGAVNLPDGTPVAWYYRLAHRHRARGPVRGPSLMRAVLARPGLRHFFLGGTEAVLRDLEEVVGLRYPGAVVAGLEAPPFAEPNELDHDRYTSMIRAARADVVWVGLGTPRQDVVIARLAGQVDSVLIGVGAAFDFLSGHKAEAPEFLHMTGFEWTYRLAAEPRRLWRRYLIGNSQFLASAARQLPAARRVDRTPPGIDAPVERQSMGSFLTEDLRRVAVGAAWVHCIDERSAIELIVRAAKDRDRPWVVVTPNIQHVALLETDARLRSSFRRADLVLADGWPVVRAVRLLGGGPVERITGADLFPALCREAARHGLRVGIVGGMGGAAPQAGKMLMERYPGLQLISTWEPPWGFEHNPLQVEDLLRQVRAADLDFLFLALGAPKQEIFAAAHVDGLGVGVTLCIGAAVDFVAGRQRRAPRLLRRFGLEWAYRAAQEPRRLLPRYARTAPVFARTVLRGWHEHRRRDAWSDESFGGHPPGAAGPRDHRG